MQKSLRSNNTNKLSPQERCLPCDTYQSGSNNTNKLSPQEPFNMVHASQQVQIIQINLVLKNSPVYLFLKESFK